MVVLHVFPALLAASQQYRPKRAQTVRQADISMSPAAMKHLIALTVLLERTWTQAAGMQLPTALTAQPVHLLVSPAAMRPLTASIAYLVDTST